VKVHVVTIFPELFGGPLATGPIRIAREKGLLEVAVHNLRDYTTDRHLVVDDVPYGGGQGMVMKPEPLVAAIEHASAVDAPRRILLAARGARLTQARVAELAALPSLLFVCGRYEGIDERVAAVVDEELSIGDYVLSGGELAALVVLDAVVRLLPGVLGNDASSADDSFATGLLEGPQYTRPPRFRDVPVPEVLLSGDHAAIARWRREAALRTTLERRPDLLETAPLTAADEAFLRGLGWGGRRSSGGA
jgi:tRNA (guanine37-N1)-methyltransferase